MTNASNQDDVAKVTNAVWNMTWLNLSGLLVIIAFSFFNTQSSSLTDRGRTAAVGVLVAVATCLVGAGLGFVFGIPRTRERDPNTPVPSTTPLATSTIATPLEETVDGAVRERVTYRANANLERISDWLATVIVGVGLTQLSVLPEKLKSLAEFVAPGLGDTPAATVAAAAIIVYYGIGGVLLGYPWTRLYFPRALSVAEHMLPLSHSP